MLARCVESQAINTVNAMNAGRAVSAPVVAVELGAGSGLVSVAAGAAGLHAIATEQESGMPYLRANAAANAGLFAEQHPGSCTVQTLHWGTAADVATVTATVARLTRMGGSACADGAPALLLGSDLTYLPAVMEPLAETLAKLAGPQTIVWIAHDDASHPGCPKHRATFFGTPQDTRHQAASLQTPQPAPAPRDDAEPDGRTEWQGTHT